MSSQAEALQRLSHLATDHNRTKVLQHLRNIRLATRDLEETFAKNAAAESAAKPVAPAIDGTPVVPADASRSGAPVAHTRS